MVEKEFLPYHMALRMKALGFDEPCYAWYVSKTYGLEFGLVHAKELIKDAIIAPTFSAAFKWFRKKYNLHAEPYTADMGAIEYCFQIRDLYSEKYVYDNFKGASSSYMGTFNTPEEAELACLEQLIEIVENK